jgi:hypothetical protein
MAFASHASFGAFHAYQTAVSYDTSFQTYFYDEVTVAAFEPYEEVSYTPTIEPYEYEEISYEPIEPYEYEYDVGYGDTSDPTIEIIPVFSTFIYGTAGDDSIVGTADHDTIYALAGDDWVLGGAGDDTLVGGNGGDGYNRLSDTLIGDAGSDYLDGSGQDWDYLWGGADADTYLVNRDAIRLFLGESPAYTGGADTVLLEDPIGLRFDVPAYDYVVNAGYVGGDSGQVLAINTSATSIEEAAAYAEAHIANIVQGWSSLGHDYVSDGLYLYNEQQDTGYMVLDLDQDGTFESGLIVPQGDSFAIQGILLI